MKSLIRRYASALRARRALQREVVAKNEQIVRLQSELLGFYRLWPRGNQGEERPPWEQHLNGKPLTEPEREEIKKLAAQGLQPSEIATRVGRSRSSVKRTLSGQRSNRRAPLKPKHPPITDAERARILELRAEGISGTRIAKTIGRSESAVYLVINSESGGAE